MFAILRGVVSQLAEQVRPVTFAHEQLLEVLDPLRELLPGGGLRRGSSVAVEGPAATSLALALAAGPSATGSWVATVGMPSLGLVAAAELGVSLARLALVADPGPDTWGSVVAALIDAFDVVLVRSDGRVRTGDGRRLLARARERGAVLLRTGTGWQEGADVRLRVTSGAWEGLGDGHGHLRARQVEVMVGGRRAAGREQRMRLWLPSADGTVELVQAPPVRLRGCADRRSRGPSGPPAEGRQERESNAPSGARPSPAAHPLGGVS